MPYVPLQIGSHVPDLLRRVVSDNIDAALSDYHFLLTCHEPEQGPKGSLQKSLAVLLLSRFDSAAQFLHPDTSLRTGERFKQFMLTNFPWHLDEPEGLTPVEATRVLWHDVRCSVIHRYGAMSGPNSMKYVKRHTISDSDVERWERDIGCRPGSPSLSRTPQRTALFVDGLYWSLRLSIIRAMDTPEKCDAIQTWLSSGKWDRKGPNDPTAPAISAMYSHPTIILPKF